MKIKYILPLALLSLSVLTVEAKQPTTRVEKSLIIFNDVMRQLDVNYTDTLDYEKLTETAINTMLRQVDPYTIYMPASKDDELKRFTTGKYAGVGAIIMQKDDWVYVSDPYEGLPAQRSDVRAGDKILSVNGKDCKGKTTAEVSELLRGKANTEVTIMLERVGEKKPLKKVFKREEIKMPTVDYAAIIAPRIGYLSFTEFLEHSASEVRSALDSLAAAGAEKLIIDLRGNGGGLISEAVQILSNFLPKGTEVVTTKGKLETNRRSYKTTSSPAYPDMPLMVLTDDHSASASEITAGALQDLNRAKLVGGKTFGKGLVQNIRNIAYDGHLKVTTARYYLPSGRCIQGTGIEPDVPVVDSTKVNITYELYKKNMFFDYANEYVATHASYPRPVALIDAPIAANDTLLEDFEKYLQSVDFTYETETSKYFADVLRFAEQEDLDSTMMADLKQMKERLAMTYHDALWQHKDEVLSLLEAELVSRYYFQRGRTCVQIKEDKVLRAALEQLY